LFSQRDEVTGQWRKLHYEEPDGLYSPPHTFRLIKSRRMRWARYIARKGDRRSVYRVLVRKPVGRSEIKRPLKRCLCRWRD